MPILNTNIPDEILHKIKENTFLKTFKNEYINVFDKYKINGNCIICDRVTYFTTETIGWDEVLKNTCIKTDNLDIYDYYVDLDIYIMEKFNTILVDFLENNKLFLRCYKTRECNNCFLDE